MPRKKKQSPKQSAIVTVAPPPERPWQLNQDEVTIVKNSIAKGASDEELKFCLTVARRYKLDPFKQQIWFVKRFDKNADNGHNGKGAYVWTPQVGINGLLFAAARDHRDEFGSISKPEYGPMEAGHPQWASVKVTKRDGSITEAEAWWDEYAPADMTVAPFWRKMPRRMLGKCATALAIREAYPDLGGLYIPEECEKINEEYTKEGRRIIENAGLDVPQMGTHAAGQAVAAAKIKQLREAKQVEIASPEAPVSEIPPAEKSKPLKKLAEDAPQVEIDWTDKDAPIVRGDIADLLPMLQQHCKMTWDKDEWWHCKPEDVKTIGEMCAQLGFRMLERLPESSPAMSSGVNAATGRGKSDRPVKAPPPAAETVKGKIQHFTEKMTKGSEKRPSQPFLAVLLKTENGDRWYSLFNRDLIPHINKAKGKDGVFFVTQNGTYWNIVGIKHLAGRDFEDNLPVIQMNDDRERTLYDG